MVRAFVALSDEIGPRIGESLGMRVKDIIFDGTDVLCRLRGKTGDKRARKSLIDKVLRRSLKG